MRGGGEKCGGSKVEVAGFFGGASGVDYAWRGEYTGIVIG